MEIEPVPVAKDLGVYVDQTLSYTEHVAKLASSCVFYKLVEINRIKHLCYYSSTIVRSYQYLWSAVVTVLPRAYASCRHVLLYHIFRFTIHVIRRSSVSCKAD